MILQGMVLVDKPKGWTSFDVVNFVRRIVAVNNGTKPKNTKVGHIGTLDPLATGLLILLVGKDYTKKAQLLSKLDKTYDVTMKLGETSTTADDEGEKLTVSDAVPTKKALEDVLAVFTGELMQTPPIYSAMKIDGQRAYKLAREGKPVVMQPRPAVIYANTLADYTYPHVQFTSRVGSGTYIRSLVDDIGKKLTTGAYMSDLRRTRIADFRIEDAVQVEGLTGEILLDRLII